MFIFCIFSLPLVYGGIVVDVISFSLVRLLTLSHNIIIQKLMKYGLDDHAVKLIGNWINYQVQRVVIRNKF